MSNHASVKAADALQFAAHVFKMMWKDWPADKACAMPTPHDNSLMWNIGHLAISGDYFHGMMTGEPGICPESWGAMFAPGTKPTSRAADYPPLAEVQAKFEATVQRMAAELMKRTDVEMARAIVGKPNILAKDRLDTALRTAWHIGWHTGQVSSLRRALGMPGVL